MDIILRHGRRAYYSLVIERLSDFAEPFAGRPYPCLVWDHVGLLSAQERSTLAEILVGSNCRYTVCAGINCEAWHDAIDDAFGRIHSDAPEVGRDGHHVMTTWHQGESANDVAFFFVRNTTFGDDDFGDFLVLHIGGSRNEQQAVEEAVRREALGETAI